MDAAVLQGEQLKHALGALEHHDAHGEHTGKRLILGRRPDGRAVGPLLPHIKKGPVPIIVMFDEGLTSRQNI